MARDVAAKRPTRMVEHAVRGMLPKNRIGDRLIRKMKVYAGDKHPHEAQQPAPFPVTLS
jgi:large subunit ribosomal protein L13